MKKIILFLVCLVFLIFGSFNNDKFLELCSVYGKANLYIFCESYIEPPDKEFFLPVKNGNGFIIQTIANNAKETLQLISDYSGFMITFYDENEDIKHLLDNVKIIKTEDLGSIKIFFAYACGLIHSTIIDGKKVNLQIAINKNIVTIGSPIILGSY